MLTTLGRPRRVVGPPPRGSRRLGCCTPARAAQQWSIAEYTRHLGETLWAMRFLADTARDDARHRSRRGRGPAVRPRAGARRPRARRVTAWRRRRTCCRPRSRWSPRTNGPGRRSSFSGDTVDLGVDRSPRAPRRDAPPSRRRSHPRRPRRRCGASGRGGDPPRRVGWRRAEARRRRLRDRLVGSRRRRAGRSPPPRSAVPGAVPLECGRHRRAPGRGPPDRGRPGRRERHRRRRRLVQPSARHDRADGHGARAEISSHATPCAKNAGWFGDRQFRRIDHDEHPGWSRLYATVLRPAR